MQKRSFCIAKRAISHDEIAYFVTYLASMGYAMYYL